MGYRLGLWGMIAGLLWMPAMVHLLPFPIRAESSLPASDYANELLLLTNNARQQAGLRPLRPSASLSRAAQQQAPAMIAGEFVGHQGLDGSDPIVRAQKAGYPSDYIGENIAAGRPSPQATINGWLQDDRYRGNLLNPRYTDVGFAYLYAEKSPYQHYWVMVLGSTLTPERDKTVSCSPSQILTAIACLGDETSPEEAQLIRLINQYRSQNQLTSLPLLPSLSKVAYRHSRDLQTNLASYDRRGQDWRLGWSDCPYDAQQAATWICMTAAPQRLQTDYPGQAYELMCGGIAPITAEAALRCWQNHPYHRAMLLNQGPWQNTPWQGMGISIDGNYAILWLGTGREGGTSPSLPQRPDRRW